MMKGSISDGSMTRCDNCGDEVPMFDLRGLDEVDDLAGRLDPGAEVPAGECWECGAFAYLIKEGK